MGRREHLFARRHCAADADLRLPAPDRQLAARGDDRLRRGREAAGARHRGAAGPATAARPVRAAGRSRTARVRVLFRCGHPGLLSRLGAALRGAVRAVAADLDKTLVGLRGAVGGVPILWIGCTECNDRVSLFFGNTLYLAAFGYYFVITFLGYNSMYNRGPLRFPSLVLTRVRSASFPPPYAIPTVASCRVRGFVVRLSVRIQHPSPDRPHLHSWHRIEEPTPLKV